MNAGRTLSNASTKGVRLRPGLRGRNTHIVEKEMHQWNIDDPYVDPLAPIPVSFGKRLRAFFQPLRRPHSRIQFAMALMAFVFGVKGLIFSSNPSADSFVRAAAVTLICLLAAAVIYRFIRLPESDRQVIGILVMVSSFVVLSLLAALFCSDEKASRAQLLETDDDPDDLYDYRRRWDELDEAMRYSSDEM